MIEKRKIGRKRWDMKLNRDGKFPSAKNRDFVTPHDQLDLKIEIIHAITQARVDKNLSQKNLAEKIGIAQSAYARFESCRTNPTLSFLQKVMNELGLELQIVKV